MKYIKFKNRGFVIFEDTQIHEDIADKLIEDEVLSAGFVKEDDDGNLECYGKSISLNIRSNKNDSAQLRLELKY